MISSANERLIPLNPADYFTLAIDEAIRNEGLSGNICIYGLELDKAPELHGLCERILEFVHRFPQANSSLIQKGRRFYWQIRTESRQFFYQHHCPAHENEDAFVRLTLSEIINRRQNREATLPVEFHLICGVSRTVFLLRWFHPWCDALGAELILRFLSEDHPERRALFDLPQQPAPYQQRLQKYTWWEQLGFIFKTRAFMYKLDRLRSIQHARLDLKPQRLNFVHRHLSVEDSSRIAQESKNLCGLHASSLYFIGCLMRALFRLQTEADGDAYLAPYAFNLRKQKALAPLLGNHLAPLFAQADKALLADRDALFKHLKSAYSEVIQNRLDFAFLPVMWLASWLKLGAHASQLRQSYIHHGERSSFWFSDVGISELGTEGFLDAQVKNIFHLCQITSPPGLALLVGRHQGRITLSYNFIEPLFSQNFIENLDQTLQVELLGQLP